MPVKVDGGYRLKMMFWKEYLERNPQTGVEQDALCLKTYGVTFTSMIDRFLKLPRNISILEVGCGAGCNLELLRAQGFTDLRGIDTNPYAGKFVYSKGFKFYNMDITKRTWYTDGRFDLVFTAGVLIHLRHYRKAMKEIARLIKAGGHVWGLEYYAPKRERIPYGVGCWRDNWSQKWIDLGFELECRHAYPYADRRKVDEMYFLKKLEESK